MVPRRRAAAGLTSWISPVGHVVQHGRKPALFGREARHFLPELVGHLVEGPGELPHFVARGGKEAGVQVPGCQLLCHPGQLPHRMGGASGDEERQGDSQEGRGHRRHQDDPPQVGHVPLNLVQGKGQPGNPHHLLLDLDGHGYVHHVVPYGAAEADARPRAAGQGLLHLRPVEVVVHRRPVLVGFAQNHPIGPDEGGARSQEAGIAFGQGVQHLGWLTLR